MDKLAKSVLSKLLWFFAAGVVFYFIGDSLHIIPQSVKDLVSWLADNFNTIAFLISFILVAYLIRTFMTRNRRKNM